MCIIYLNASTKNLGNINLCSFTTGIRKKNKPVTIKNIPKYFHGSSNRSPKTIMAAIDSIKALKPSHAAFTSKI